eukprot:1760613-Rhodomonas_salina.1
MDSVLETDYQGFVAESEAVLGVASADAATSKDTGGGGHASADATGAKDTGCLLYTSPSPRDRG